MKLQTEIPLIAQEHKIDYSSKILLLGSCFAENIGRKFDYYKFQHLLSPFGVIFNPVSIENLVRRAIDGRLFSEDDIFQNNGVWKSLEVHSKLSSSEKNRFLENLNQRLETLRKALLDSTHIILTFGTSWVYRHCSSNKVVANCHKLPQKNFQKELLSINEIETSIAGITAGIHKINPKSTTVFTVSPVRHLKDGFVENSLGKAHLLAAIHSCLKVHSEKGLSQNTYFPSYEIMMDELRDYRFYTEDMIHPNNTAVEIIWEKFSSVWLSSDAASVQKEIASIQSSLCHRPFNPESPEHLGFLQVLQQKIERITQRFPHLDF